MLLELCQKTQSMRELAIDLCQIYLPLTNICSHLVIVSFATAGGSDNLAM